jgi:hypothetical protein
LSVRGRVGLIAGTLVVLVSSGCGGSGNSGANTDGGQGITVQTGSLSKAQFIKQADAICAKAVGKTRLAVQAYARQSRSSLNDPKIDAKLINTVLLPEYKEEIDRIKALGAPSGDEEKIAAIIEETQQGLREAREDPVEFVNRTSPFHKALRLGEAYGFNSCGGP